MAQSHHVSSEFVSHWWGEHPVAAGVINYHFFLSMVPISLHQKLKAEVDILHKLLNERQTDNFKLLHRLKSLEDPGVRHKTPLYDS